MPTHAQARDALLTAWRELTGQELSPVARQAAQAVARHETNYGNPGSPPEWQGSHNWGAIHNPSDKPPCTPGKSFLFKDFNVNSGKREDVCFKAYPDDPAGARDFLRTLYIKRLSVALAADTGDADAVALAMYDTSYFTGEIQDKDPLERRRKNAAAYAGAIERNALAIAAGLGEPPMVVRRGGAPVPTPRPPGPAQPPPAAAGGAAGGVALVAIVGLAGVAVFMAAKGGNGNAR